MNAEDLVHRQIRAARRRMDALQQRGGTAPPEAHPFVDDAIHELQTALEELQVSEEELRQQNETLAESREQLEAQRERYRDLFHFAPDAYLVTDADGVVREANRAAASLLGVGESALAGKPLAVFVDARSRRDFRLRLARVAGEERVEDWELRLHPRRGGPLEASCSVAAVRGRGGTVEGLRWLLRDVTERRRAEEGARRLEAESAARAEAEAARERVETVLESIADGFLALDAEWRLTYVNRAAEFLLHCDRAAVLGRDVRELFGEDAHPALFAELRRAAERHDSAELEEFHPRLASWLEFRVFPSPDGLTLHVRDVTEQKVTQEELRSSEERLRMALQAAGLAPWDWDLRTGVVICSAEHNRMMGLPPEQQRGSYRAFLDRVHPEDRVAVSAAIARATGGGEDYRAEFRALQPDGGIRWIAGYGRPLPGPDGRPARLIGVIRDVTEQKRADEERDRLHAAVEAERARLQAMMEQMPAGVMLAEAPSGTVVAINRRAVEILGPVPLPGSVEEYSRDFRGSHPDGRPFAPEDWPLGRAIRRGERVADQEVRFRPRGGGERVVMASAAPVRDAAGTVVAGVLAFHDVTEQRRREEADRFLGRVSDLLASSLDYRTTAQSIASLCAGSQADYCIVHVEEHGKVHALGTAHSEPARQEIVRGLMRRFPVDPEGHHPVMRTLRTGDAQLLAEVDDAVLAEMAAGPEQLEMLRDLGLASMLVVPLQARGRTLGALTLARTAAAPRYGPDDVEPARELARRAALAVDNARLYEEARQASRARDEVLAVVSHDLRNPLHAVLLASTVLEDFSAPDQWSARDLQQIRVIRRSAEQMTGLIQDLVEVIAMETGAPALNRERLAAAPLPAGVAELFQAQADEKGLRLRCEADPGLPPVEADRGRLLQVFSNLVGNAIKFTPSGGTVTLRATPGDGVVHFSVSDTGPGIAPEHLASVFDRFWRARKGERGGLGLGLAIARGIVEAHGGRIWAESTVGEGATFHFTVPSLSF
ncbi:MAG TPA: PAS domain S-box protein [Longimicrobiaceae bacterium]|nr:PAS domain S-box protein [Longimicrobiaceae bacterium]